MSFADVVKNSSTNMGEPQDKPFRNVRSLICVATDLEKQNIIQHLMKDLVDNNLGSTVIQRVTKLQPRGEYALIMANTIRRDEIRKKIEDAIAAGTFHYSIKEENPTNDEQFIVLTGFPEEMRINCITAYMTQYLWEPKGEILKDPDFGFEIGELKITHKGLKKPLGKRVWIGPNVSAYVKETSIASWDNCVPICSNCLDQGHLYHTCNQPQKCRKCRKVGHIAQDCEKCECCKKWGHSEEICFFNPQNPKKGMQQQQKQQAKSTEKIIQDKIESIRNTKNITNEIVEEESSENEGSSSSTEEDEDTITQSNTENSDEETDNENDKDNEDTNQQMETETENLNTTQDQETTEDEDESENDDKTEKEKSNRETKRPANESPHRRKGKITKNKEEKTDCKVRTNSPSHKN